MASGVIIVSLATVMVRGAELQLVFILKVDHRPAISYKLMKSKVDVKATMEGIATALVEDRAAVQRSALVDVSTTYAWDVLAAERNEGAAPELKIFFKAFLGVKPREDDHVLTRRAVSSVSVWAKSVSVQDRPEGEVWQRYRERATQYLKTHEKFNSEEFISTVVKDADNERRHRMQGALREYLREQGIEGQEFESKPGSLTTEMRRTKLSTAEGVELTYEGDQSAHRIEIEDDPEYGDGAKIIKIRTRQLIEKT